MDVDHLDGIESHHAAVSGDRFPHRILAGVQTIDEHNESYRFRDGSGSYESIQSSMPSELQQTDVRFTLTAHFDALWVYSGAFAVDTSGE